MLNNWLSLIPLAIICLGLRWSLQMIGLQFPTNGFLAVLFVAISLLVNVTLVFSGRALAKHSPEVRAYLRQPGPTLLPETTKERFLFVPLSLTHSFAEEVLFRGFMFAYLTRIFPDLPAIPSLILAALFFGIGHLTQKLRGVLGNGVIGLALGLVYFSTGSLLPGMLIHALFNLRILLLPRHSSVFPANSFSGKFKENV